MRKVPTGIEGLDKLLEGGFPENWSILLTGSTGTGKTTLAVQYLYNGFMKYGEPGVFISLEEDIQKIARVMELFGWDLKTPQMEKKLVMINATPKRAPDKSGYLIETPFFSRTFSFDSICDLLEKTIEETNAKRVIIDGLSGLTLQYQNEFEIRQGLLDIANVLSKAECTTLYTSEMPEGTPGISRFGIEEFIAYGVIILYYFHKGGKRIRAVEIRKMRGSKHDQSLHPYEITEKGIVVFPEEITLIERDALWENMIENIIQFSPIEQQNERLDGFLNL